MGDTHRGGHAARQYGRGGHAAEGKSRKKLEKSGEGRASSMEGNGEVSASARAGGQKAREGPGGQRRRQLAGPRRKGLGAKAPETPRQVCMTTLSDRRTDLPLGTSVEVVVGSKLQNFCLFTDNFVCNLVGQRQDALQPIQQARWHLVVFILFL